MVALAEFADWSETQVFDASAKASYLQDVPDVKRVRAESERHLVNFFADKEFHCGGPIPEKMLKSNLFLDLVSDVDIECGIQLAYLALAGADITFKEDDGDIKLVLETLKDFSRFGIPKYYAGGLLLVYLNVCKGVSLDRILL